VRDRFKLFAWGLNLKEALLRRRYFLEAVSEIKLRLRKVLYLWQDKKAERNFLELALLIENYDKDDPKNSKKPRLGKLSKKSALRLTKEPLLQTVDEEEEKCDSHDASMDDAASRHEEEQWLLEKLL
jgi:hypothetical protein